MSKTIRVNAVLTVNDRAALRALGFDVDERGGDATRSTLRNAPVRRTGRAVILSRKDGAPMSAADLAAARVALSKMTLTSAMKTTLAMVRDGRVSSCRIDSLVALRRRGLITLSVVNERSRYAYSRIVAQHVSAALTDAGRAAL